jgi:hypothetical protein
VNGTAYTFANASIRRELMSIVDRAIVDRAKRYLECCDPAISGSHGHDTTFREAIQLVVFAGGRVS